MWACYICVWISTSSNYILKCVCVHNMTLHDLLNIHTYIYIYMRCVIFWIWLIQKYVLHLVVITVVVHRHTQFNISMLKYLSNIWTSSNARSGNLQVPTSLSFCLSPSTFVVWSWACVPLVRLNTYNHTCGFARRKWVVGVVTTRIACNWLVLGSLTVDLHSL